VPLIDFGAILPPKRRTGDNCIADLEAEIAGKTKRKNSLLDMEDIDGVKDRIRNLDGEIKGLKKGLAEARRAYRIAQHTDEDWLDQLLRTLVALQVADNDERYVLRARIAQELRRIIEKVKLNDRREMLVMLKPASGYRAEMTFRNEKFDVLRLADSETGEVTLINRFLFLSMMHHVFANKGAA
jgi:hypothetical protein